MSTSQDNNNKMMAHGFMFIVPTMLHVVGFYFLYSVRHYRKNNNQYLYLLALSFSEILVSAHMFIKRVVISITNDIIMSGIYTWFIVLMVLLTVDRFFEVYLNITYPLHWNSRKTKSAIGISMSCLFLVPISLILTIPSTDNKQQYVIFVYIYPIENYVFTGIGVIVYGYIFKERQKAVRTLNKIAASVRRARACTGSSHTKMLPKKTKGNFYIPALLMITFFLFWVIPDIVITYYLGKNKKSILDLFRIVDVLYCLALTSDAFIYTLCSSYVRRKIMKITRKIKPYRNGGNKELETNVTQTEKQWR